MRMLKGVDNIRMCEYFDALLESVHFAREQYYKQRRTTEIDFFENYGNYLVSAREIYKFTRKSSEKDRIAIMHQFLEIRHLPITEANMIAYARKIDYSLDKGNDFFLKLAEQAYIRLNPAPKRKKKRG